MKQVRFIPEITLGNVMQTVVMLGSLAAYLINNEHRMSVLEVTQKSDGQRIVNIETAIGPIVTIKPNKTQ